MNVVSAVLGETNANPPIPKESKPLSKNKKEIFHTFRSRIKETISTIPWNISKTPMVNVTARKDNAGFTITHIPNAPIAILMSKINNK